MTACSSMICTFSNMYSLEVPDLRNMQQSTYHAVLARGSSSHHSGVAWGAVLLPCLLSVRCLTPSVRTSMPVCLTCLSLLYVQLRIAYSTHRDLNIRAGDGNSRDFRQGDQAAGSLPTETWLPWPCSTVYTLPAKEIDATRRATQPESLYLLPNPQWPAHSRPTACSLGSCDLLPSPW